MPTIEGLGALATGLAKLRAEFKTADTNADGALTLAEFEAAAKSNTGLNGDRGQTAALTFKQLDVNGNGLLTPAELTQSINLSTQIQSVLIQGQELQSNYLALLGGQSQPSLFGSSSNFGGLTTSLLGGGSASSSLTTLYSGGNLGTSLMEGLFGGGGTNALVQQYLARYDIPSAPSTPTTGKTA